MMQRAFETLLSTLVDSLHDSERADESRRHFIKYIFHEVSISVQVLVWYTHPDHLLMPSSLIAMLDYFSCGFPSIPSRLVSSIWHSRSKTKWLAVRLKLPRLSSCSRINVRKAYCKLFVQMLVLVLMTFTRGSCSACRCCHLSYPG